MRSSKNMLTKRISILFTQRTWDLLVLISKAKNTSVSELVRIAVKEKYQKEYELS